MTIFREKVTMKTSIDTTMVTDINHNNSNKIMRSHSFADQEKLHRQTSQILRTHLRLSKDNKGTNNKIENLVRLVQLLITRHL